ncbi:MAG TPA: hypothetical protein VMQ44_01215 [Candidatus Saccharimonadales bacterium]|nr:hypothetical protein [Candidatus Saccharimonadales bacterium]
MKKVDVRIYLALVYLVVVAVWVFGGHKTHVAVAHKAPVPQTATDVEPTPDYGNYYSGYQVRVWIPEGKVKTPDTVEFVVNTDHGRQKLALKKSLQGWYQGEVK